MNLALEFLKEKGLLDEFNAWKESQKEPKAPGFNLDPAKVVNWRDLQEGHFYYTGKTEEGGDVLAWIYSDTKLWCGSTYIDRCWFDKTKIYEITQEEFKAYSEARFNKLFKRGK